MIVPCVPGTAGLIALNQFRFCFFCIRISHSGCFYVFSPLQCKLIKCTTLIDFQIIDTFLDSVMSVCLTKTELIGGSVDGTVRTFDIRIGRYVGIQCISFFYVCKFKFGALLSFSMKHYDTRTDHLMLLFCYASYREISDDLGQPVNCISMSNDGNCVLASCLDSTLRLVDR